jgi:hypothetical protein
VRGCACAWLVLVRWRRCWWWLLLATLGLLPTLYAASTAAAWFMV